MRKNVSIKLKNIVTQFNNKLKAEVIKEDLGCSGKDERIIPAQEHFFR